MGRMEDQSPVLDQPADKTMRSTGLIAKILRWKEYQRIILGIVIEAIFAMLAIEAIAHKNIILGILFAIILTGGLYLIWDISPSWPLWTRRLIMAVGIIGGALVLGWLSRGFAPRSEPITSPAAVSSRAPVPETDVVITRPTLTTPFAVNTTPGFTFGIVNVGPKTALDVSWSGEVKLVQPPQTYAVEDQLYQDFRRNTKDSDPMSLDLEGTVYNTFYLGGPLTKQDIKDLTWPDIRLEIFRFAHLIYRDSSGRHEFEHCDYMFLYKGGMQWKWCDDHNGAK